jgi:hypothetical protein
MQATARLHHSIPNPILQEADGVFHDPVAFHSPNGMLDADADGREATIRLFFRGCEVPPTRFLLRLEHCHIGQQESLEPFILIQTTTRWQGVTRLFRYGLIRCFPFTGVAQKTNVTGLIDQHEIFECVTLLLATVVFFLLFSILRTLDWPFSTIMPKRGDFEVAFVLCCVSSAANSSAVRAGSRSWSAKA